MTNVHDVLVHFMEITEICRSYAIVPFSRDPGGSVRFGNLDNPIGISRFSP